MPMTDAAFSAKIKSEIIAQKGAPLDDSKLQAFCDAMGAANAEYIQANAVVTITTAAAAGVTPGGASVPVTGTGTVG